MGFLVSHEGQLNLKEESLTNAFSTQASLNICRGRGARGWGKRGRGSHHTEDITTQEQKNHTNHSDHSQS